MTTAYLRLQAGPSAGTLPPLVRHANGAPVLQGRRADGSLINPDLALIKRQAM